MAVPGLGFRVQDSREKVPGFEFEVQMEDDFGDTCEQGTLSSPALVQGMRFRGSGLGVKVEGQGFWLAGLGIGLTVSFLSFCSKEFTRLKLSQI
jgi:hypothetical protein